MVVSQGPFGRDGVVSGFISLGSGLYKACNDEEEGNLATKVE
jgi:hypothetical protein